ncbi:MAG: hypothetical protein H0V01_04175 [Bacteroidetes bacterium]|nr:hypothetical protein [Bacteroidota bacterium]HET6245711.1 hypothetical protein [Bacteroidia bacterium]
MHTKARSKYIQFILTIMLLQTALDAFSQERPVKEQSFKERLFFGGNFGLQFGNETVIDLSPLVGYRLTDKLSAGAGITYMYYRLRVPSVDFSTNIYGGRLFGRYFFLDNLFGHVEYEILNLEVFDIGNVRRVEVTNILVGGGYRQHLGGRTFINILALWNINQSEYSPYRNPIIRMGIGFGI